MTENMLESAEDWLPSKTVTGNLQPTTHTLEMTLERGMENEKVKMLKCQ